MQKAAEKAAEKAVIELRVAEAEAKAVENDAAANRAIDEQPPMHTPPPTEVDAKIKHIAEEIEELKCMKPKTREEQRKRVLELVRQRQALDAEMSVASNEAR